jgi:hypothetical protein
MLTTKKTALWLPFEGGTVDKGVNSFSTTPTAITYTAGLNGKVASFNGTSSKIEITNSGAFMQSLTDVTICFWIYINSANTMFIMSNRSDYANGISIIKLDTGLIRFDFGGSNYTLNSLYISIYSWHFVACRRNSTYRDIFIDTSISSSTTAAGINNSLSNNLLIGWSPFQGGTGTGYFNGYLKNFQIYNKYLSDNNLYRIRSGFHPII